MLDLTDGARSKDHGARPDTGTTLVLEADGSGEADRPPAPPADHATRGLVEWLVVLAGALLVALLIRTFLVQAYTVSTESMTSTVTEGDRVAISPMSYRLGDVDRGDVVVFDPPPGADAADATLLQRVVGLPGESIAIEDSRVVINGIPHQEGYLDGSVDYPDMAPVLIPADHVFVLGDNRADSRDSRSFGPVAIDEIDGRAVAVIWPPGHLSAL